jgi:hypothetical protein
MHQSTYERLRAKHDDYIERGNDAPWDRMMAPILKALDATSNDEGGTH